MEEHPFACLERGSSVSNSVSAGMTPTYQSINARNIEIRDTQNRDIEALKRSLTSLRHGKYST